MTSPINPCATRWCATLCVGALLGLGIGACGDRPPGSGSIDGMNLGLLMELHLEDLTRLRAPDANSIEFAKSLFAAPPLDSVGVYSASAEFEEEGELPLRLWVSTVGGDASAGRVVLAIDQDGRVRRARLWGHPDFDNDPEAGWENFWRQFEYDKSRSVIPTSTATSDAAVDSIQAEIAADATEGSPSKRTMYEHRLIMYANNFVVRGTMATARGQSVPPLDWMEQNRRLYKRLQEMAGELQPVIGDSAAERYRNVAAEGGELLELMLRDASVSGGDAVRDRVRTFRRRTCGNCHGIENHTAGEGELKDALFFRLKEFGVRLDLYRVGLDVWPVPNDVERSQRIANTIKAMLVIAGSER